MAHFVNSKGTRISNAIIKGGIDQPMTIGVYGAAGLSVGPNDSSIATMTSQGADQHQVTWYRLTGKRIANVMVEAKMGASVWDYFQLVVGEPSYYGPDVAWAKKPANKDGRYTENANEVVTKNTKPAPADVITLLLGSWSALTETGARVLTAQFMHETGEGVHCYNWNLGNVKCAEHETSVPHMYLRDVWERLSLAGALQMVKSSNGLGYLATEEECKKHGWTHTGGKVIAVFEPPSYVCRFKAYASLAEGAQKWMDHHRSVAKKFPDEYVPTLNSGDCTGAAHILKRALYYSGDEGVYAHNMTEMKAKIDRQLGPAKP